MPPHSRGGQMLAIPGNAKLFLYQRIMSMRKSFEGLSSAVFFLNKRKVRWKQIYIDKRIYGVRGLCGAIH